MNLIELILILMISFTSNQKASSDIKVRVYIGFDCTKSIKGESNRGACIKNEVIQYNLNRNESSFHATSLKVNSKFLEYKNSKFKEVSELTIDQNIPIKSKISSSKIDRLWEIISTPLRRDTSSRNKNQFRTYVLGDWNFLLKEINKKQFKKALLNEKNLPSKLSPNELLKKIKTSLLKKNEGISVYSNQYNLSLDILHQGNKFKISQSHPSNFNIKWRIKYANRSYYIVSPEINNIVYNLLPLQIESKKTLRSYFEIASLIEHLK